MDEPQYYDVDGKPCTLDALCIREPAWAASRPRLMLAKIRELEGKLEAAEKALSEKRGFGDPVSFMEHHELQSCLEGYERQLALIAVTHPHLVSGFVVERQRPSPLDCSHLWLPLNEDQASCETCGAVEWRGIARV